MSSIRAVVANTKHYSDEAGFVWNPDDVDIDPLRDPSTEEEDSDQYSESEGEGEGEDTAIHSVRAVSEDIVASMEM